MKPMDPITNPENFSPSYTRAFAHGHAVGYHDAYRFILDMIRDGADLSDIEEEVTAGDRVAKRALISAVMVAAVGLTIGACSSPIGDRIDKDGGSASVRSDAPLERRGNPAVHNMPACAQEDSPGPCYWDAKTRGNGMGRSFIVVPAGDPAENDDDEIRFVQ